MNRNVFFACLFLVITKGILAQKPESMLEKWSLANPIEKVWLHFDRDAYTAGETAWFKAYLSSDYLPDTISTTLHVQLLDKDLTVVSKVVLPILLAGSNGQLELPDTLTAGTYTLRAFTPSMMTKSPDFIFKKGVYIYGKTNKKEVVLNPKVRLNFFPEGGNMVTGFNTAIAFKAIDEYGMPIAVSGSIKNSKGTDVITFSPVHDGMGLFEIKPAAGEKYYAVTDMAPGEKFPLPEAIEKGIAITLLPHPQGYYFEVQQKIADPLFTVAYAIGQMQNRPVFKLDFSTGKESLQGVINTLKLQSGILQVTFFNKDGAPLAERLCFINNKEYLLPVNFIADTTSFNPRGRNRYSFSFSDTVQASMSVSVTDAAYEQHTFRSENILTALLLTSDIKGYVHNPAYYFLAEKDSAKTAADLVMMTNGWRRFSWKNITAMQYPAVPGSSYITISGKAVLRGTNRPFDSKPLLLLVNGMGARKSRSSHMLTTDKDGRFVLDSLVFYDRNRLLFTDIRGKKSQYIDVNLSGDSLHRLYAVKDFESSPDNILAAMAYSKWKDDYEAIQKANGILLQGVIVKAVNKNPMQVVDDKYTTGMFSGDAVRAIDLVNSDEAVTYNNIFDYLQSRVNGLTVSNDDADMYALYFRQGASASSMGNIPMTIFLDEIETDASVVATLHASQVALVKIYQSFVGAWGNAPGGAIAIYTKKGEDYRNVSAANISIYNGYSVIKEFYAPDYKVKKQQDDKADNRITLDWRPNIIINSINPKVPFSFYNNDRTKAYKVVLEGMTSSGKLIWLEKVVKP